MDLLDYLDNFIEIPDIIVDDSGDEIDLDLQFRPRTYRINPRINFLDHWNDDEFFKRFRMSKTTVQYVLSLIEPKLINSNPYRNRSRYISPMLQLLIAIRYYATSTFQSAVGDMCSVSRPSVTRIVRRVSMALTSLRPQVVRMPTTDEEFNEAAIGMYKFAKFPKCIGSIDCTHIKIQSPGGNHAEYYRNRKGWFSLNVQTICSADLKILDIVCRWPGATHDQTIFNSSVVKTRFELGQFRDYCLIGDMGYANTTYLATPMLNCQTPVEQLYNESCIRSRNCVERKYGVLKRRFPCLAKGMQFRKFDTTQYVITACAVLHNICIDANEQEPPLDPDIEREIIRAQDGLDMILQQNDNVRQNNLRSRLLTNYFPLLIGEQQRR